MSARNANQAIVAAVRDYQHATRRLRVLLEDVDAGLDSFLALVRAHQPVTDLLLGTGASKRRHEFAQAMEAFERSRRRLRVAVLRSGVERGESVAAMAKALGISRQLAHRHLTEDRG